MRITPFLSRMLQVIRDNPNAHAATLAALVWPDSPKVNAGKQQPDHYASGCPGLRLQRSASGWRSRLLRAGYIECPNAEKRAEVVWNLTQAGHDAIKASAEAAFMAGHVAFRGGLDETSNPYPVTTDEHLSWNDGWEGFLNKK